MVLFILLKIIRMGLFFRQTMTFHATSILNILRNFEISINSNIDKLDCIILIDNTIYEYGNNISFEYSLLVLVYATIILIPIISFTIS